MIPFYQHSLKKNKNYLKKTISSFYLTSESQCEIVKNLLKKKFKKICIINLIHGPMV